MGDEAVTDPREIPITFSAIISTLSTYAYKLKVEGDAEIIRLCYRALPNDPWHSMNIPAREATWLAMEILKARDKYLRSQGQ